jgi:CRISPR/Cas system-associated exonuclease Cas4 (RecB family)
VTEILRSEGFIDFSMVPAEIMERAQIFGTALHKATELWDKNDLDITTLSAPLIPYLEAWRKFIKDFNITIKPDEIERHLTSKKLGFQGTPDRFTVINGKITIVDLKSSTSMYPATEIQTAAYQILVEENTGLKVSQRWGVQLTEKGTYKIEPYKDPTDRSVFLSALNIYNWKRRHL